MHCGDPRLVAKLVGEKKADRRDYYAAAGCGNWVHAKYLTYAHGRDVYAYADPCCGSGSGSGSGSSGGCVFSCCPNPKRHYYVTLTNQGVDGGFGFGCDCIPSITVPVDLTAFGTFAGIGPCELWYQWDGVASHAHCFNEGQTTDFYVRLECDPAGFNVGCMAYTLRVQIDCTGVGFDENRWESTTPDACTCNPFYLHFPSHDYTNSPECCRDINGDAVDGIFDATVTE